MNNNPKKYKLPTINQQINEPSILLEKKQTQKNEELLEKLLQLGLKQSEQGLGIPHSEVMAKIKLKYNLKF